MSRKTTSAQRAQTSPSRSSFGGSFLDQLEITVWHAANASAFPVLDLDELRRHADDDVETSPVADDCSDLEHAHTVHNRTIDNLTARADPSVRTAASISIDESGWRLGELDAGRAAPCACLARAGGRA